MRAGIEPQAAFTATLPWATLLDVYFSCDALTQRGRRCTKTACWKLAGAMGAEPGIYCWGHLMGQLKRSTVADQVEAAWKQWQADGCRAPNR